METIILENGMVVRKSEGSLSKSEKSIVKGFLSSGWRNQDIQALVNIGRAATINSARITEVKNDQKIKPASDEEQEFYIKRKNSFDPKTGLNLYDDERLIRSRESMILAVHIFNSPSIQFKTEAFAVQANIAWTYLLHEFYERKGVPIFGKDNRSILLSQMLERADFPFSNGIKNNIKDIIDIRNDVEHKLFRRSDVKFFHKFQTCCLNFDKSVCALFGDKLSLKNELSLALQFAKLDFEQAQTLSKFDVPPYIEALDARLDERLSDEERYDIEYQFKVVYTLENATKKGAHIEFIRPGSEEGREIHNILEKYKISDDLYPYKASEVFRLVGERTGKKFNQHTHRQACRLFKAKPDGKSKQPNSTNKDFCIYHPTFKTYTYSERWVEYLISAVLDDAKFAMIGKVKL